MVAAALSLPIRQLNVKLFHVNAIIVRKQNTALRFKRTAQILLFPAVAGMLELSHDAYFAAPFVKTKNWKNCFVTKYKNIFRRATANNCKIVQIT